MFASLTALLFLPISTLAQSSSPTILCIAGQCLSGYSNTTIGTTLTSSGSENILLLPGTYNTNTNPQLLHDALTSSSASFSPSAGFNASTPISLPLTVALQPGVSFYENRLYSGKAVFTPLAHQQNASTPVTASSFAVSSNAWVALEAGASNRVVIWNSVPDVAQLPVQGSLSLLDIQSSACTPSCSTAGVCSASGTCQCQSGFNGTSCETCASGFFGPTCQACPTNCTTCDEGITGTGRCLMPTVANAPSTCNCKSGLCGSNGSCTCTPGFTTGSDGTLCSKCLPGFFLDSTGNCQICQLGCTQCSDGTGQCTSCASGFTQDSIDKTKCDPAPSITTSNQVCPDGSFANGASCSVCSSACQTCNGGTSNNCIICASGTFSNNGSCVSVNNVGVCSGTSLVADNTKHECDTCGANCTKCQIPGFNGASIASQKQCTGCLPGFFLSNGTCVSSCPSGTTVSSQDNLTCIACDASCTSCAGSSTFCLTCSNNQLASKGQCVSTCPSATFSSAGACLSCHPDCSSCNGGSFNQCTSCPADRPVLINGRCLPTCSSTQFFDATTGQCQSCDSSCESCSAAGPLNCLSCASATQKLQAGTCVAANCISTSNVVNGLGVCLSDLVITTAAAGQAPIPTVSGINSTTVVNRGRGLQWWEILLMALGCAFIFLAVIWCFRRRQQKKRQAKYNANMKAGIYTPTYGHGWRWKLVHWVRGLFTRKGKPVPMTTMTTEYSPAPASFLAMHDGPDPTYRGARAPTDNLGGWRWKLIRWGEKFFGHPPSQRLPAAPRTIVHLGPLHDSDMDVARKLRAAEEAQASAPARPSRDVDMVRLIESYNRPLTPGAPPGRYAPVPRHDVDAEERSLSDGGSRMSAQSLYSQMTRAPRRVPDPRQPVKKDLGSRFDASTFSAPDLKSARRGAGDPF